MDQLVQAVKNAELERNHAAIAFASLPIEDNESSYNIAQAKFLRFLEMKRDLYPSDTESDDEHLPPELHDDELIVEPPVLSEEFQVQPSVPALEHQSLPTHDGPHTKGRQDLKLPKFDAPMMREPSIFLQSVENSLVLNIDRLLWPAYLSTTLDARNRIWFTKKYPLAGLDRLGRYYYHIRYQIRRPEPFVSCKASTHKPYPRPS